MLSAARTSDSAIARLIRENYRMAKCLAPGDYLRFLVAQLKSSREILRTRSLGPADKLLSGHFSARLRGSTLEIPAGEIDSMFTNPGAVPTFGGIREMYANDVYLWPFLPDLRCITTLDIGSNRGLFSLISVKVLGSEAVVRVEPDPRYGPAWQLIAGANGISPTRVKIYERFCGAPFPADSSTPAITINEILEAEEIEEIGFLKMDIQGSEISVFKDDVEWLDRCKNIAMELHPFAGDLSIIPRILEEHSFQVLLTNQHRRRVPVEQADYLYASSSGDLRV